MNVSAKAILTTDTSFIPFQHPKKKTKQNKTRGKQNFPERQPERRFRNFGNQLNSRSPNKKKKERFSKSLLFFSITTCMRKKLHKNSIETHCNREIEPCVK
jgi:hypothetical protein